jgi:hypothetical protein
LTTDIDTRLGCSSGGNPQNCGCGGDACGADGCNCVKTICTDHYYDVKNATPSGYSDDNGEWYRQSTAPLTGESSLAAVFPAGYTTGVTLSAASVLGRFEVPIDGYVSDDPINLGTAWLEFRKDGDAVIFYDIFQQLDEVSLVREGDGRWFVVVDDSHATWLGDGEYEWRFRAFEHGDRDVCVDLIGKAVLA